MKPIYKEKYPHLFEPLILGKNKVEIKNRVFTAPMGCPVAQHDNGRMNEYGVYFYGRYAKGGFGMVNAKTIIPVGPYPSRTLNLEDERMFMDVHFMNEYAHAFGAKTGCEMYHQGALASPAKGPVMSSTEMVTPNGIYVKEMTLQDMEDVTQMFVKGATLIKRAGFDQILLHYGHGWLMSSFLSPAFNHRKDEFNGSPENRMRFPKMVIERIRKAVGGDLLIDVRLSGSEFTPGGIEIEDTIAYVKMLEDLVDSVHITCGNRNNPKSRPDMHPSSYLPAGHNAENAWKVKQSGVKIPVGVVGGISDPALAEQIIAEGKADFVLMGRQATIEPNWVEKVRHGHEEDIRPCMRCNFCIDTGRRGKLSTTITYDAESTFNLQCAADPTYGQGFFKKFVPKPEVAKDVVVVGGGFAGLEAAMTAAERGHRVTLLEQTNALGGVMAHTEDIWFKYDTGRFRDYLICQCKKNGVNIRLNTKATRQMIDDMDPDAVIVAIGSEPVIPKIPGVDKANVITAEEALHHPDRVGKKAVIIGGGLVGCETAIILGEAGIDTHVIEFSQYLMGTSQFSQRIHTTEFMEKAGATYQLESKCTEILDDGVDVEKDGVISRIKADTIVLAVGRKPLVEERESFRDSAFDVIFVGDCNKVGNIPQAIRNGYDAAIRIQ